MLGQLSGSKNSDEVELWRERAEFINPVYQISCLINSLTEKPLKAFGAAVPYMCKDPASGLLR
jgi:hypothetical protein